MEQLEIKVDLETAAAVANARALAKALRDLREQTADYAGSADAADRASKQVGDAAQKAAPQIGELANKTKEAAANTGSYTQNVTNASHNVTNFSNAAVTQINNVTNATKSLESSTSGVVSQVTRLVASYFGLQAAIRLIDQLLDRMAEAVRMQQQLTGEKFDDDRAMISLMANLQLEGQGGLEKARGLRNAVSLRTGSSLQRSGEALEVTNASGIDVNTGQGQSFADEIARLAERRDLDRDSLLQFARGAKQRGVTTPEGLQELVAKGDAVFGQTLGIDPARFWRGAVGAVGPEVAKGVDPDVAMGMYSAFVGETRDERMAAFNVRAVANLASSPSKKAREFFAHQAATMGATHPGAVSDADVEDAIASDPKMADRVAADRGKIASEERRIDTDQQHFDAETERYRPRHTVAEVEARQQKHETAIAQQRESIRANEGKLSEILQTVRQHIARQREETEYNKLSLQQRIEEVILPMGMAVGSDRQKQNEFIEQSGGMLQRDDALFLLAKPEAQEQMRKAMAAARAARASDTQRANEAFRTISPSINAAVKSSEEVKNIATVDPGQEYAARLQMKAEEARKRDEGSGKYNFSWKGFVDDAWLELWKKGDKDFNRADQASVMLRKDMVDLLATLPAGSADAAEVEQIIKKLDGASDDTTHFDDFNNFKNFSTGHVMRMVQDSAVWFGNVKARIENQNRVSTSKTAPTVQPSGHTAPPTSGARSDATVHHHGPTINVQTGPIFTGGEDASPALGRLVGLG